MIESTQNDKIKWLNRLSTDNRFRKKSNLFVVEGVQENERAIKFGYEATDFFICSTIFSQEKPDAKIHEVSEAIYNKIAYRKNVEGIVGIYKAKNHSIEENKITEHASIIVIEGIEKPGNLGAILRSCEAFGINTLMICDAKTDIYNPNVIRSSVGCLFGMNIINTTNEKALRFFQEQEIPIFTTYMAGDAKSIYTMDFKEKFALIFGTEHSGITDFWLQHSENIIIPMYGTIDSLNLSNAVAISCYEIAKQRNDK